MKNNPHVNITVRIGESKEAEGALFFTASNVVAKTETNKKILDIAFNSIVCFLLTFLIANP